MDYERKHINYTRRRTINDYLELENAEGMPGLVDSTLALDLLITVKSGIRNYGIALTEIADPESRRTIISLLEESIDFHAAVTQLMVDKGWFHPYNPTEQFQLDKIAAKAAMDIANLKLFEGDTSRMGTFATPNY